MQHLRFERINYIRFILYLYDVNVDILEIKVWIILEIETEKAILFILSETLYILIREMSS